MLKVEGERFKVPQGSLGSIAAASPGLGLRAGMGVFVAGYSASLVDQDFSQYTLQAVGGKQLKEESTVRASALPSLWDCSIGHPANSPDKS